MLSRQACCDLAIPRLGGQGTSPLIINLARQSHQNLQKFKHLWVMIDYICGEDYICGCNKLPSVGANSLKSSTF